MNGTTERLHFVAGMVFSWSGAGGYARCDPRHAKPTHRQETAA